MRGMVPGFRYARRVQFHETDLAGVVHFSWFFRYMEEAEHALWRAAGLSVDRAGGLSGWPRVSATFDFRSPLHFEDAFDVFVSLRTSTTRTIVYDHVVMLGDTAIGGGSMTAVYATREPGGGMKAAVVPPDVVSRLVTETERAP